jgi:hypothetical protein
MTLEQLNRVIGKMMNTVRNATGDRKYFLARALGWLNTARAFLRKGRVAACAAAINNARDDVTLARVAV